MIFFFFSSTYNVVNIVTPVITVVVPAGYIIRAALASHRFFENIFPNAILLIAAKRTTRRRVLLFIRIRAPGVGGESGEVGADGEGGHIGGRPDRRGGEGRVYVPAAETEAVGRA